MKILSTRSLQVPEVKVLEYARFADDRGYFTETIRWDQLWQELGRDPATTTPSQMNESYSRAGVVRGIHIQFDPPMAKLVRVIQGRLIDLAVDLRPDSETFGSVVGADMIGSADSDSAEWIYIPEGFGHAVLFPEPSMIEYICTAPYNPAGETSLKIDDPDLDWTRCEPAVAEQAQTIIKNAVQSPKDADGISLKEWSARN